MKGIRVKVRAICGPTESEEKVRRAIRNLLHAVAEPAFTVHNLSGIFGEPLRVIEADVADGPAEQAAKHLIESLPSEYVSERIESSGSVETIHLRLNKQLAYLGIIQPAETDAIKVEITSRK
ncbi:MAG: RNA-binding domain-containing protein [Nitrososphaerota archaeon]|nr:hypothetical protein [Candidatus Calditenuaceae archaeon]MDW8072653.1 RNA-binding domain-containing protein [Nitrososphaerota archaeon]